MSSALFFSGCPVRFLQIESEGLDCRELGTPVCGVGY